MRTIESIKPNEVIHCPTEQEAIEFCNLLHKSGRTWSNGDTYCKTNWKIYKTDTVYNVTDDMYADIEHYKEYGKTITNVKEFLMQTTTQTIPYEGMKEIHDIACSGWKKKIAEWTKVFEDTQLSKEQVNEMFRAANTEQKKVLNKWLKESQTDIEALKQELKELVLPYPKAKTKQEKSVNAIVKAFKISETFNEEVELKWEDTNTYKYYPYKYFVGGGFRFRVFYDYGICRIPAGLCFVSESLCQKAIDNFPEVYNDYWMLDK